MEWILLVAAIGLMILGLADVVKRLVFWGTESKESAKFIWVIMPETADSCEFLIRSAAERMRWLGLEGDGSLLCINNGETEEIQNISSRLAEEFPYLTVSNSVDLGYNTIKNLLDKI